MMQQMLVEMERFIGDEYLFLFFSTCIFFIENYNLIFFVVNILTSFFIFILFLFLALL
jgi:hypothetical protein